jgi:Arc/MetJ-type ribon-helix-helix transcriptional regulator
MKLSISLPEEDVAFVDDYARRRGASSRSLVVHRAIELLRQAEMPDAYAAAWDEWAASDDAALWDRTVTDGLADGAR